MSEMKELKDLRFGDNELTLRDNSVESSIIPKTLVEMDRNITVAGNVKIAGPVYVNKLEISGGPARFEGSVFGNVEIHVQSDCDGDIFFAKAVASSTVVSALLSKSRCVFGSDINAPTIKLRNCFVGGSIYGSEIQLENCAVLGGVFASKKITAVNSVMGTFNTPEIAADGTNYLIYPSAFSVEPISMNHGLCKFYNLALADLGSLYKGEEEKANTGKVLMDMKNSDVQETRLSENDDATYLVHSYSISSRVILSDMVDFENLENHFLILNGSLGTQVLKQYSLTLSNGEKGPELTVEAIAKFFLDIAVGRVEIREISGDVTFDELKRYIED